MTLIWWHFRLPESTAYVPALSEAAARMALAATCYKGAPVNSWPCFGVVERTREELVRELLEEARA